MRLVLIGVLAAVVGACGGDGVEAAREETIAFVDTIQWPAGYEPREVQISDPNSSLNQGRSGSMNVFFDHQGESEPELMAAFHESFEANGFVLRGDAVLTCGEGRIRLGYNHKSHAVGTTLFSYMVFDNGQVGVSVGMGWGERPPGDLPDLAPSDVALPVCE